VVEVAAPVVAAAVVVGIPEVEPIPLELLKSVAKKQKKGIKKKINNYKKNNRKYTYALCGYSTLTSNSVQRYGRHKSGRRRTISISIKSSK
jgi:hypothetical protein